MRLILKQQEYSSTIVKSNIVDNIIHIIIYGSLQYHKCSSWDWRDHKQVYWRFEFKVHRNE